MISIAGLFKLICLIAGITVAILLLLKWTEEERQNEEDYFLSKPPLYVYFQTSGIKIPMFPYFLGATVLSLFLGLLFGKVLNNIVAGMAFGIVLLIHFRQGVENKSFKKATKIDFALPQFLNAFYNIFQHKRDPIFALHYANGYAAKEFKNEFEEFYTRLSNNADVHTEVKRLKLKFKNPIIREFLDAFESEVYDGFGFEDRLERLIERAETRKEMNTERKISTFQSVMTIRVGTLVFLSVVLVLAGVRPDLLNAFRDTGIGQGLVVFLVLSNAFMLQAAQKIVQLTEG
ncbi:MULTISPECIES: hypothetical protein [Bacillus subtilis group]|uniref:hypothetical protein n=1 Tax=Bacillus subtilis group TaxID=653685 RepID=UPI001B8E67EC|nr:MULTISPECIES: hypothetical protein [Bacillus subtilis group]MEC2189660.1 hypothetical protein [Bacillus spizizenii]MEC2297435.1 hypothetical protein [Bacillus subtilis]MEC2400497.1 hypothetical protein [Bacillus subtilis]MED4660928.1 hypothetical protein [Bacillus subtilis]MED4667506.1 hypothetical protein [Bacillus subtilis]